MMRLGALAVARRWAVAKTLTHSTHRVLYVPPVRFAHSELKTVSGSDFINKVNAKEPVVIFSATYCGFCRKAQRVVGQALPDTMKAQVFELDLNEQPSYDGMTTNVSDIRQALARNYAQHTVPAVFVQGHFIGGCTETVKAIDNGQFQQCLDNPVKRKNEE
eukprot:m.330255 g.330255  ORF g.330255 m.330255 type:complete len:161 (+) comp16044_c0_seq9:169-651(+)